MSYPWNHLPDCEIDQGHENCRQHVADFYFFDFKKVDPDGHDQEAADDGHLIDDIRRKKLFHKRGAHGDGALVYENRYG